MILVMDVMDVMMCGDISFSQGEFLRGKSVSIILHLSSI